MCEYQLKEMMLEHNYTCMRYDESALGLLNISPQCPAFGVEILLHYVFPAFSTLFCYDLCFIHLPLFPIQFLSDRHGINKVDVTCV